MKEIKNFRQFRNIIKNFKETYDENSYSEFRKNFDTNYTYDYSKYQPELLNGKVALLFTKEYYDELLKHLNPAKGDIDALIKYDEFLSKGFSLQKTASYKVFTGPPYGFQIFSVSQLTDKEGNSAQICVGEKSGFYPGSFAKLKRTNTEFKKRYDLEKIKEIAKHIEENLCKHYSVFASNDILCKDEAKMQKAVLKLISNDEYAEFVSNFVQDNNISFLNKLIVGFIKDDLYNAISSDLSHYNNFVKSLENENIGALADFTRSTNDILDFLVESKCNVSDVQKLFNNCPAAVANAVIGCVQDYPLEKVAFRQRDILVPCAVIHKDKSNVFNVNQKEDLKHEVIMSAFKVNQNAEKIIANVIGNKRLAKDYKTIADKLEQIGKEKQVSINDIESVLNQVLGSKNYKLHNGFLEVDYGLTRYPVFSKVQADVLSKYLANINNDLFHNAQVAKAQILKLGFVPEINSPFMSFAEKFKKQKALSGYYSFFEISNGIQKKKSKIVFSGNDLNKFNKINMEDNSNPATVFPRTFELFGVSYTVSEHETNGQKMMFISDDSKEQNILALSDINFGSTSNLEIELKRAFVDFVSCHNKKFVKFFNDNKVSIINKGVAVIPYDVFVESVSKYNKEIDGDYSDRIPSTSELSPEELESVLAVKSPFSVHAKNAEIDR